MIESLGTLDAPPQPDPTKPRLLRLRLATLLVLGAMALGAVAGLIALTAPSTTVQGEVVGFGSRGGECYPTVSYQVGGETYRFTESRDPQWCALDMGGPALVYHDPDHPSDGRLSRSGDLPWLLARSAIVLLVAAAFVATWGRRGEGRQKASPPGSQDAGTSRRGSWGRIPRLLAWVLVAGWVVTAAGIALQGERSGDFGSLVSSIEGGDLDVVEAAGALDAGSTGTSIVELHWRVHGLRYVAEVKQVRGNERQLRRLSRGGDVFDGATGRIEGDLAAYLSGLDPSVRLEPTHRTPSGMQYDAFGWQVTGWLLWPVLALLLVTLRLLAVSPEPWRATRFAWFWPILLIPVLGPLAFLLFGGPTGAARALDPRLKRFTGGWAFLLTLLLSGAFDQF